MSASILFLATVLATSAVAIQQPTSAPPKPSSNTPDDRLPTPAIPPAVAIEGCVETDRELPGRRGDIAGKMGLDKHFVLANGKVVKGKAPIAAGAGLAMYRLQGLTDEQLKLHVGRRVRVDGSFGNLDASTPAAGGDALVELNVATIRQIPGDCSVPKS